MPGVYPEIWESEVERAFRSEATFLNTITDRSKYVGNRVIHLTELGVDPEVLVDNTVYPIGVASSEDQDVPISLRKMETTNTRVTDDELYGISYDKIGEKVNQHKEALIGKAGLLAAYSLSPQAHTVNTPIVRTTGAVEEGTGRKRLRVADIVSLKLAFDKMKIPQKGRHLVLSAEHVADLLLEDQKFASQYSDIREGKVLKLHGFEIHEYPENVYYDINFAKKPFDSVPVEGDRISSFAFYAPKMVKAMGSEKDGGPLMKMYYRDAKTDPEHRESVVGFRTYFVCLPRTKKYYAAIVSA